MEIRTWFWRIRASATNRCVSGFFAADETMERTKGFLAAAVNAILFSGFFAASNMARAAAKLLSPAALRFLRNIE